MKVKRNCKKLERAQRLFLIRQIKGYRTISFNAACVIAGVKPICIQLNEYTILNKIYSGQTIDGMVGSRLDKPIEAKKWLHPAVVPKIVLYNDDQSTDTEIYTDGSRRDDNVGCAFVVMRSQIVVAEEGYRLGLSKLCSNNQAEQFAILKALDWLSINVKRK